MNPDTTSATPEQPSATTALEAERSFYYTREPLFDHRRQSFEVTGALGEPDKFTVPTVILPPGHTAITYPLDMRRKTIAGTVIVSDREALIAYLKRYCTEPKTLAVYANLNGYQITAILDHHDAGVSGRHEHQVLLTCRMSPIMRRWKDKINQWLSQEALIDFAEAEARHFKDGAKLITMARHFEVQETVNFSRKVDPDKGTMALTYENKQNANVQVPVPSELVAEIPIFEGGPPVKLVFTPRYKVPGGKLSFMLYLPNLEDTINEQFDVLVGQIREDIHEFEGKDWDKVLVIDGMVTFTTAEAIEAKEIKGLALPAPVVAGGASSR